MEDRTAVQRRSLLDVLSVLLGESLGIDQDSVSAGGHFSDFLVSFLILEGGPLN